MPEGDTIAYTANRIRPILEGRVPRSVEAPQRRHAHDCWPERLADRCVTSVDTHGKHLFIRFEDGLALHSHLGMSGVWGVYESGRRWGRSRSRAWIVLQANGHHVVEFDGPVLELMTDGRTRFDHRLAALGPDIIAAEFDRDKFLRRLRADDPTRPIGDALLDQTTVAGIGNIWKAEGCWEAGIDPWRTVGDVSDAEALELIDRVRPRMQRSAVDGPMTIGPCVYRRASRPCPRCGTTVCARAQGDGNRTTYWCPGCQR